MSGSAPLFVTYGDPSAAPISTSGATLRRWRRSVVEQTQATGTIVETGAYFTETLRGLPARSTRRSRFSGRA